MKKSSSKKIEALMTVLPQTQCGDCGYQGCQPYAHAIVHDHERIDRCLPGGIATMKRIADLTQQDPEPYIEILQAKQKPPATAIIDETVCIGCTKCIAVCPVDAIIGAAKLMHTIIHDECTGCGLCVEPCPVDCIDLKTLDKAKYDPTQARQRFDARNQRITQETLNNKQKHQAAIHADVTDPQSSLEAKQAYIQQAIARVKDKKNVTTKM